MPPPRPLRLLIAFVSVLVWAVCPSPPTSRGQGDEATQQAEVEVEAARELTVQVEERSPHSRPDRMGVRFHRTATDRIEDYDLAEEQFLVRLPRGFTPEGTYGVMVYISPADVTPETHRGYEAWASALDAHGLILIEPMRVGNDRNPWHRVGLALDGVHYIQSRYQIDDGRVYACGMSGGGKIASMLGLLWGGVFDGSFSFCGTMYYRNVPLEGSTDRAWGAGFNPPDEGVIALNRTRHRYVLLTGEKDPARQSILDTVKQMKREGYERVTYLEVPEMGHQWPPAAYFEKGVDALDPASGEAGDADGVATQPAEAGGAGAQPEADRHLAMIRLYLQGNTPESRAAAEEEYEALARDHPNSPQRAEAGTLMGKP